MHTEQMKRALTEFLKKHNEMFGERDSETETHMFPPNSYLAKWLALVTRSVVILLVSCTAQIDSTESDPPQDPPDASPFSCDDGDPCTRDIEGAPGHCAHSTTYPDGGKVCP